MLLYIVDSIKIGLVKEHAPGKYTAHMYEVAHVTCHSEDAHSWFAFELDCVMQTIISATDGQEGASFPTIKLMVWAWQNQTWKK